MGQNKQVKEFPVLEGECAVATRISLPHLAGLWFYHTLWHTIATGCNLHLRSLSGSNNDCFYATHATAQNMYIS